VRNDVGERPVDSELSGLSSIFNLENRRTIEITADPGVFLPPADPPKARLK